MPNWNEMKSHNAWKGLSRRILWGCLLVSLCVAVSGEQSEATQTATNPPKEGESAKKDPKKQDLDFDPSNEDWGSYYDPQNIFCGKFDCYKILGFDYESFGAVKPEKDMITKRYRRLSRFWHPDKSKHKDAKERFVKIARAYEVLTNKEQRKEYDAMRYNQDAYFMKYGTSVLWSYAPKSDTTVVIVVLFLLANVLSWFMQKHRWQMVADRLIKATVEDWSPSQGGSPESKSLREDAMAILAEREAKQTDVNPATEATPTKASGKKKSASKSKQKLSMKEKKQQEQEALLPIVTGLVNQMSDFGAGYHKPTWKDLFVVGIIKAPYYITVGMLWQLKYWSRRMAKQELNDEEREVLTQRAVGPVAWDVSSDEDRDAMVKRKLWVKDNLVEWKEEQEVKKLSAADQKMYAKLKKKGKAE